MVAQAFWLFFRVMTLVSWLNSSLLQPEPSIPDGFKLILSSQSSSSDPGFLLYQKNYSNGSPDFVQTLNLHQGTTLLPLHGTIVDPGLAQGVYGGNNPSFKKKTLPDYWRELVNAEQNPVCVFNGQFFFLSDDPTHLPFPLKKGGMVISDGYGLTDFPDQKLMLEVWANYVDIKPLSLEAFNSSTALNIIAGLTEDANKRPTQYTGRTFVGIDDRDGDGQAEIVLIFNTLTARQSDAAKTLREFGADKVMMLDGGGSTQLMCEGNWYVRSDRLIPQALAVVIRNDVETIPFSTPQLNAANAEPPPPPEPTSIVAQAIETALRADNPSIITQASPVNLNITDVIWVPIFIIPMCVFVMIFLSKVRQAYNVEQQE